MSIGFAAVLLFPLLLIVGVLVGLYAGLIVILYKWNKMICGIVFALSMIALVIGINAAWNQYMTEGYFCLSELCFDNRSHPSGPVGP